MKCFDDPIDSLEPKRSYKVDKRAVIVEQLDRFVAACASFHRASS